MKSDGQITQQSKVCHIQEESDKIHIVLEGSLSSSTVEESWEKIFHSLQTGKKEIEIDTEKLDYCDGAGIALLFQLRKICDEKGISFSVKNFKKSFQNLLDQFPKDGKLGKDKVSHRRLSLVENVGRGTIAIWNDWKTQMAFLGEMICISRKIFTHPGRFRWKDAFVIAEKAGVNALPIVGMIGFLMGVIMAFESSMSLRQFGVDIFVVNVVALAILRELGPIMTAIMLAGRSGSAFAAEIGTMKVNEELDALKTMGIEPSQFLALPRIVAGTVMTPILTLYANFIGIAGGLMVVMLIGHPWAEIYRQLRQAVEMHDFFSGLIKSVIFGMIVAGIGCLRGLQTASGATAVGDSTTRAVVSGIFLIVFADAIFSFVFYAINF